MCKMHVGTPLGLHIRRKDVQNACWYPLGLHIRRKKACKMHVGTPPGLQIKRKNKCKMHVGTPPPGLRIIWLGPPLAYT